MSGPAQPQAMAGHVPDTTSNATCRPKTVLAPQPQLTYATLQTCDPTLYHNTVQSQPTYATLQPCNSTLYPSSAQYQSSNAATSTAPQPGTSNQTQ